MFKTKLNVRLILLKFRLNFDLVAHPYSEFLFKIDHLFVQIDHIVPRYRPRGKVFKVFNFKNKSEVILQL